MCLEDNMKIPGKGSLPATTENTNLGITSDIPGNKCIYVGCSPGCAGMHTIDPDDLKSQRSICLCFSKARIRGVYHHAWLVVYLVFYVYEY